MIMSGVVKLPRTLPRKTVAAVKLPEPRGHLSLALTTVVVEIYAILQIEVIFVHVAIAVILFGREVAETIFNVEA
jgi:hypothetical protein